MKDINVVFEEDDVEGGEQEQRGRTRKRDSREAHRARVFLNML